MLYFALHDSFGVDAIGIQYQQGLKDLVPASDLAEGLLNNVERPPAFSRDGRELYAGKPLPHFNEVDECAGVDALVTNRIWAALGFDPATTLHDVRWGEQYTDEGMDEFVWLFQISGAVPPSHLVGGYAGAVSERQPAMYFRLGGGTLKGICKPGEIVWSRVFVENGSLHVDIGRGTAIELPAEETERRWREVTYEWPIMHVLLHGVTQNQFMARHPANHVNVAYAPSAAEADRALAIKATMLSELGLQVHLSASSALVPAGLPQTGKWRPATLFVKFYLWRYQGMIIASMAPQKAEIRSQLVAPDIGRHSFSSLRCFSCGECQTTSMMS